MKEYKHCFDMASSKCLIHSKQVGYKAVERVIQGITVNCLWAVKQLIVQHFCLRLQLNVFLVGSAGLFPHQVIICGIKSDQEMSLYFCK